MYGSGKTMPHCLRLVCQADNPHGWWAATHSPEFLAKSVGGFLWLAGRRSVWIHELPFARGPRHSPGIVRYIPQITTTTAHTMENNTVCPRKEPWCHQSTHSWGTEITHNSLCFSCQNPALALLWTCLTNARCRNSNPIQWEVVIFMQLYTSINMPWCSHPSCCRSTPVWRCLQNVVPTLMCCMLWRDLHLFYCAPVSWAPAGSPFPFSKRYEVSLWPSSSLRYDERKSGSRIEEKFDGWIYRLWLHALQDDDRPMIEIMDQLSPVILESVVNIAVSDTVSH